MENEFQNSIKAMRNASSLSIDPTVQMKEMNSKSRTLDAFEALSDKVNLAGNKVLLRGTSEDGHQKTYIFSLVVDSPITLSSDPFYGIAGYVVRERDEAEHSITPIVFDSLVNSKTGKVTSVGQVKLTYGINLAA